MIDFGINLENLTFEEVVNFCKREIPEGINLDYKKELSPKGISKLISAFANTNGGLVIIGVEEDKNTGKPLKWEGITNLNDTIERINQDAGKIIPPPPLKIFTSTKGKNNNYFVLILVSEGIETPYYIFNDPNIWIRTGNISKPIDIANPQWAEYLFFKRQKADIYREKLIKEAKLIYDSALNLEEKRRIKEIESAKMKNDGSEKNYYQKPLGQNVSMCEIIIMPFYPYKELANPRDIKQNIREIQFGFKSFPDYNLKPMPSGLYYFTHGYNGYLECQQIFSNGLIFFKFDFLKIDKGLNLIDTHLFFLYLFLWLKVSQKFYKKYNYNGSLILKINFENTKNCFFKKFNYSFKNEFIEALKDNYQWNFDFDTFLLNENEKLIDFFKEALDKIYWDIGYLEEINKKQLINFLKQNYIKID